MKFIYICLFLLSFLTLSYAIEINTNQETYLQGETVFVKLNLSNEETLESEKISFAKKSYPLFKKEQGIYYALIGIDLGFKPGAHFLAVNILKNGSKSSFVKKINIEAGNFRKSIIEIPKKKMHLAKPKQISSEANIIGSVFASYSKDKLWQGDFIIPINSKMTTPYGASRVYNNGYLAWWHRGVDLAASIGTNVLAANSGVIALASDMKSHGKTVIIDHGQGIFTVYCHLSEILVKEKDFVEKSQVIAKSGNTGITTGPHLHWGLSVGNTRVDPIYWLSITKEVF